MGNSVTVARLTLDQLVQVRILVPQVLLADTIGVAIIPVFQEACLYMVKNIKKMLISKTGTKSFLYLVVVVIVISGCNKPDEPGHAPKSREEAIPDDAVKGTPEADVFAPVLHSEEWKKPVPMEGPINTAGAEDSPFIIPDGNTFYFCFIPDVDKPPQQQLIDGVSGIWWSKKVGGTWTEPERIILNNDVSLDGCTFVQGDTMWFGSVRAGNYGEVDVYTAKYEKGEWTSWKNAGQQLNEQYDIDEFHISADGGNIYFGWSHGGGFGGRDIWKSEKINGGWTKPVNLGSTVNSKLNEAQPFLSSDGNELWFTGQSRLGYTGPAVFRCVKTNSGDWSKSKEIISNFAGEPTVDSQGNIYFVHHFFSKDIKMIEADIYVAYRK